MKQLLITLLTAFTSALVAVVVYTSLNPPEPACHHQLASVRQVDWSLPSSPVGRNSSRLSGAELPSSAPGSFAKAAAIATPAVVNIRALQRRSFDFFGPPSGATGSGVIISPDGYIVTNHHVVEEGFGNIEVTLADQREYRATLIGTDPTTDLALVKIDVDQPLPYLQFANSDSVLVGEWVLAVGNPFNLESTVTAGIVSAKGRNIDILEGEYKIESFIQTDAAVNPGNSGGALVSAEGQLIGVNTAIITRSGRYEGYSFAIPANLARKVVADLREFGEVKRAILGVRISEVNAYMARRLGLDGPGGVAVQAITPGGAADLAGLQPNDVITSIGGQVVSSIPELQEFVARYRPGNVVTITFARDGQLRQAQAVLKGIDSHSAGADANTAAATPPATIDNQLGWIYRDLAKTEKDRLDLPGGVIVEAVDPSGPLATTRMERGFIVLSVHRLKSGNTERIARKESRGVQSTEDLQEALADWSGQEILLEGRYEGFRDDWGYTLRLD